MKKLNFQETLKLLQSDEIYSSCDESDFDETQLIESFSSEDSEEDDSIIEDEVVCIEQENLSNVQVSSSSHFSNEEVQTRSESYGEDSRKGKVPKDDSLRKMCLPQNQDQQLTVADKWWKKVL